MLKRAKLTKKFLMELQNGAYIVSNCFYKKGVPIYAGRVTPLYQREMQWRAIAEVAADQRLCYVFANKEAAERWLIEAFQNI
jgi:hypothetical protein